jgi:3-hydroxy-D-aspartate aldolase
MADLKKELICRKKLELNTPCLVLDLDLLDENLQKMQSRVKAAGKALRPHAKTHKCSTLAKMQIANGAVGICAAKVSEAETLVDAGISGVLITGPVAGREKASRLVSLLGRAPFLMAVVDHPAGIELLEAHLAEKDRQLDVLLDIDIGHRRTGVPPGRALDLAERVRASKYLRLRGIQAYAGHVQHIPRYADRRSASREGLRQAAAVFKELQAREESCTIFSASGTGTAKIDLSVAELTELQAGSYALMDAEYLAIESADGSDAADYHRGERAARPPGDRRRGAEGTLPGRRTAAGDEPRIRQPAVRLVWG